MKVEVMCEQCKDNLAETHPFSYNKSMVITIIFRGVRIRMKTYNNVEVIINNKHYTLCGYESDAYMQMVANYLNDKYAEIKKSESYSRMDQDMKGIMIQLNIADEYLKTREKLRNLEEEMDKKNTDIFDLKHETISLQSKMDVLQEELDKIKSEHMEAQKKIVKLETELEERKRESKKRR